MLLKDIEEKFPFLSVVTYGGQEYIGIIINQDHLVTSMYVYTDLKSDQDKKQLIALGEVWWWESNRMIPINIFLRDDMQNLSYSIVTMNTKDVKITLGPTVNISNLAIKRIKRKQVQLVRKTKD